MNRAFEKELSRALATELDTAAPKTLLRRCRAEHVVKQRSDWRDLLHCQFKLLGWKVWALEAMAALALYSVGRELALWEKAWTLRNALSSYLSPQPNSNKPHTNRDSSFFIITLIFIISNQLSLGITPPNTISSPSLQSLMSSFLFPTDSIG